MVKIAGHNLRLGILESLSPSLRYFGLIVLVIELGILPIVPNTSGTNQTILIIGQFALLAALIVAGVIVSVREPKLGELQQKLENTGFTEIASRAQYVQWEVEAIRSSSRGEILLALSKLHKSAVSEDAKNINPQLFEASARSVGVRVLVKPSRDSIGGASELFDRGITVRFSADLEPWDLHFLKTNENLVVMGFTKGTAAVKGYTPTQRWAVARSNVVGALLKREFEKIWGDPNTETFEIYAKRMIKKSLETAEPALVAEELGVPQSLVVKMAQ